MGGAVQELQTGKEELINSPGHHNVEKQGGDPTASKGRHTETPAHRAPGHHIKAEKIRGDNLVAESEKGLGGNEKDMPGVHRKPSEPTQRKTKGHDHTGVSIPITARRLLSPRGQSVPTGGGRLLVVANSGSMQQRRDIIGAEGLPSQDIHNVWNSYDHGIRRRPTVHSARDTGVHEGMGGAAQNNKRIQPTRQHEGRDRSEIYEEDTALSTWGEPKAE